MNIDLSHKDKTHWEYLNTYNRGKSFDLGGNLLEEVRENYFSLLELIRVNKSMRTRAM
jgi:hypothetical protein